MAAKLKVAQANDDASVVQDAYRGALKALYGNFSAEWIDAGGDTAKKQMTEKRFQSGLSLARAVRDRALALI